MRRIIDPNRKPEPVSGEELKQFYANQPDKKVPLDPKFPVQNKFIEDPSRFITAQCSRRAGKSNGLALKFFRTLEKHPKSACIYLALTRDSAKSIMWPILQEINDKLKLKCTFIESKLMMKHPNGAKLTLYGADMKNFITRLKGQKSPAIGLDEAQDFGPHIQELIDGVLTPMLTDYEDSWIAITGTPGPVPMGYFFDITQGKKYGYSYHEWTLLDNPYLPDAKKFIDELIDKRQWEPNHPTLLREWYNRWVLDVESLWIRYKADKNHFTTLPPLRHNKKYNYIMGIDWGYRDSDAIAILAYSDESNVTYLVDELVTPKQDITALIENVQGMMKKYDISKMVMDEGGGGKKMAEEMRRRHSIPVEPAEKARKQETVEFFNDALRLGTFKAGAQTRFAKDSYIIQIDWDKSTQDKIVVKKYPHSDIIDAVIYAFKCSPAYAYEGLAKAKPKIGSKEWADAQQDQMWDKAKEFFESQQEMEKKLWGHQDD